MVRMPKEIGGVLDSSAYRQALVGGLLAVSDPNDPNDPNDPFGDFVYFYDGNGNVAQVVNWAYDSNDPAGAIVAKYEYDPYGRRRNYDPNVPEYDQPWRFSTKRFAPETGLYDFDLRLYSPGLGRWISRDPLADTLLGNPYWFVNARPVDMVDPFGLWGDDFHLDLVRKLAKAAGICCADNIAAYSNAPDTDPERSPVWNGAFAVAGWYDGAFHDEAVAAAARVQEWHFPIDKDGVVRANSTTANAKWKAGMSTCDLRAFAEGLHTLADSWSHQGKPYFFGMFGHGRGTYDTAIQAGGLSTPVVKDSSGTLSAALSSGTDDMKKWPADVRGAAMAVYSALKAFKENCHNACPGSKNVTQAECVDLPGHQRRSYYETRCVPVSPATSCGEAAKEGKVAEDLMSEYPGANVYHTSAERL